MKNLASALTAAFMFSGSAVASAQQQNALRPPEIIVEQQNYTVLKLDAYGGLASPNVNIVVTLCPTSGLTSYFSKSGAAVLFAQAKHENLEQSLKDFSLFFRISTNNIPRANLAYVDNQNNLIPVYTPRQIIEELQKRIDGQATIEGSAMRNVELLAKVHKHVENFCFSNL